MKIFVSYSRGDSGVFAQQIHEHIGDKLGHEVFTDINDIQPAEIWSQAIEENISMCDIFVVIVTLGALRSDHVENEVLLAQKHMKKILPCFHAYVKKNQIKWGLDRIQGFQFDDKYQLVLHLHSLIDRIAQPKPSDVKEPTRPANRPKEVSPSSAPQQQEKRPSGAITESGLVRAAKIGLGIIALVLSIFALTFPASTFVTIVLIVGLVLFMVGIERILQGIVTQGRSRWGNIGLGILVFIISIMIVAFPGSSLFVIVLFAMGLLVDGTARVYHGATNKTANKMSRIFSIGTGAIEIGLSIGILAAPAIGAVVGILLLDIALLVVAIQIIAAGISGRHRGIEA